MIAFLFGLATALTPAPGAVVTTAQVPVTQEEPGAIDKSPGRAEYTAILAEFEAAQQKFFEAYDAAKTDADKQKAAALNPDAKAYQKRLRALAAEHPQTDVAFDCFLWIAQTSGESSVVDDLLSTFLADFDESPRLGDVCMVLQYSAATRADGFLETLLKDSPHDAVKGMAAFALATRLAQKSEGAGADAEPARKRAIELFELVLDDYPGIKSPQGLLGALAKPYLFELENLAIGMECPDIEGKDADGVTFKLSDYRGKVVFIDFWGYW